MTSAEWLNAHGVRRKRLLFSDLVASLAFRHCDGVLRNPSHQPTSEVDVVPSYEIIQAKYCSKFVHLRWKDGGVVHINLTTRMAESFQERLEHVTARCRERMSWLRRGSRELFGTILEDCVALVVDTSSSMELHLPLVKHKFVQLVQEQLCHKRQFTVLQYSTSVNPWRPRLVPVSTHTMGHAKQWVESLQVGGTSNLLDVLQLATTLPHVQGVYLLTDGRPDQVRQTHHTLHWFITNSLHFALPSSHPRLFSLLASPGRPSPSTPSPSTVPTHRPTTSWPSWLPTLEDATTTSQMAQRTGRDPSRIR